MSAVNAPQPAGGTGAATPDCLTTRRPPAQLHPSTAAKDRGPDPWFLFAESDHSALKLRPSSSTSSDIGERRGGEEGGRGEGGLKEVDWVQRS